MQTEEKLVAKLSSDNNNNVSVQLSDEAPNAPKKYLWKKEFTQEEIAKLVSLQILFFDKADYPRTEDTSRDLFRQPETLFLGPKRASNLKRSDSHQDNMRLLFNFINLQDQRIAAYILGTNFQAFNLNLAQEIIQTQLIKFRTIQPTIKTPKREYPTTQDNVVTLNVLAEIHNFFFMQNPVAKDEGNPIAILTMQQNYQWNQQSDCVEKKIPSIIVYGMTEEANLLFPLLKNGERTSLIFAPTNNEQKIKLNWDIKNHINQFFNLPTFTQQCFLKRSDISVNGKKFTFAAIDFTTSQRKLLELCEKEYSVFLKNGVGVPATHKQECEKLKQEYFEQYEQAYKKAVTQFIDQEITNPNWQQYALQEFQPVLDTLLKQDPCFDEAMKHATAFDGNKYLTSYDFKFEKNSLSCEETIRFFQTCYNDSHYQSKNGGPLFSFKLTHTLTRGWFGGITHSTSPITLVMHEPLENIVNIFDPENPPKSIEEIFPSMASLLPQKSSYFSINCSFMKCCPSKPKYQPLAHEDTTTDEIEITETTTTLPPTPKTMDKESNISNFQRAIEEELKKQNENVTTSVTYPKK